MGADNGGRGRAAWRRRESRAGPRGERRRGAWQSCGRAGGGACGAAGHGRPSGPAGLHPRPATSSGPAGSDASLQCPNETQAPGGVSLTAAGAPGPDPQTLTDMQEAARACPQEDEVPGAAGSQARVMGPCAVAEARDRRAGLPSSSCLPLDHHQHHHQQGRVGSTPLTQKWRWGAGSSPVLASPAAWTVVGSVGGSLG